MGLLEDIKKEISDYGKVAWDAFDDYRKSQVKKRIAKEEEERLDTLREKESRYAYYTELITLCNSNVNLIKATLNSTQANLSSLGKRGSKEKRIALTEKIDWLKSKLKEEVFLADHYSKLRDNG